MIAVGYQDANGKIPYNLSDNLCVIFVCLCFPNVRGRSFQTKSISKSDKFDAATTNYNNVSSSYAIALDMYRCTKRPVAMILYDATLTHIQPYAHTHIYAVYLSVHA